MPGDVEERKARLVRRRPRWEKRRRQFRDIVPENGRPLEQSSGGGERSPQRLLPDAHRSAELVTVGVLRFQGQEGVHPGKG